LRGSDLRFKGKQLDNNLVTLRGSDLRFKGEDFIPPANVAFDQVSAQQLTDNNVEGESLVVLNWSKPLTNALIKYEYLGEVTGTSDEFHTRYLPISGTPEIVELTSQGSYATTITQDVSENDQKIAVDSFSGVNVNFLLKVGNEYLYVKQLLTYPLILLDAMTRDSHTTGDSVINYNYTIKGGGNYSIDSATGKVSLVDGDFTTGNTVLISYLSEREDTNHYAIYRIAGNNPVGEFCKPQEILNAGGVLIDNNVTSLTLTDRVPSSLSGEDITYYIFAVDGSANINTGTPILIETIPPIPQDMGQGTSGYSLSWTAVTGSNVQGVNIFRCSGTVWDAPSAVQLNNATVPNSSFVDGSSESYRVSDSVVPYPIAGHSYVYRVETEDTETSWVVGTSNQSDGVSEVLTATKG
jgi:hypothetical protein